MKGVYRFKNKKGYELRINNLITSKGYDFWTGSDPTLGLESISNIVLGTSLEGILDLEPTEDILSMQSLETTSLITTQPSNFKISMEKSTNSAVITHTVTGTLVGNAILHELGLTLGSGELLSNSLLLSNEKTDIVPILVSDQDIDYELNVIIPELTKEYEIPLSNNGDEITYKVKLELLDILPTSDFSLRNPIKLVAKIPYKVKEEDADPKEDIPSKPIRLSSFNKATKEVTYNIVFPYTPEIINKPENYDSVIINTSVGCYKVTLSDMTSGSPVNSGFPETNAKDLIIPFKLTL